MTTTLRVTRTTPRAVTFALLAVLLLGALSACGAGPNPSGPGAETTAPDGAGPSRADEETAVRGLLDKINDAWARGDATGYASFHTTDADLVDFRGVHAAGRQQIIHLMQPAFDSVLKNTRVEARIVDLRFLGPDVAIFHTEGQIVPTGALSIQTFVTTRTPDGWQIAAFQNTRIDGDR